MKRALLIAGMTLALLTGCQNRTKKEDSTKKQSRQEEPTSASREPQINLIKATTTSGKTFVVKELKLGASLSQLTVGGEGFPNTSEVLELGETDPIETTLLADLDENGFQELYIITRSAGSGSYATIMGIASFRDKSYGSIYIPGNETYSEAYFEGYMGHDKIYMENNVLFREFPVYKEGDPNSNPTGGTRLLTYKLVAGEAGYILKVISADMIKR